ncbi:MAG: GxxExxY protein [Syntrophomonadaceae bacterium]
MEKVYENALLYELGKQGINAESQVFISVYYEDMVVGEYFADIIVEDLIIVELKAISELAASHEVQLINYLKATKKKVGLLINFGDKITIRRKIMDKKMKK